MNYSTNGQNVKEKRRMKRKVGIRHMKRSTVARISHNGLHHLDLHTIWVSWWLGDRNRVRVIKEKGPEQR